jgi:hypothetical protein
MYQVDGVPCQESYQGQPDQVRGVHHPRERGDAGFIGWAIC